MIKATDVEYLVEEIKSGKKDIYKVLEEYMNLSNLERDIDKEKKDYLDSVCDSCDVAEGMDDLECDIETLKQENKNLQKEIGRLKEIK